MFRYPPIMELRSQQKVPTAEETETKFRAVHQLLVDNQYEVLMVEAGARKTCTAHNPPVVGQNSGDGFWLTICIISQDSPKSMCETMCLAFLQITLFLLEVTFPVFFLVELLICQSIQPDFVSKMFVFTGKSHLRLFLAGEGESYGVLTARYLSRLKREKGVMLAVCTSDYGEMTDSPFCTYYELKSAVEYKIDVLPLQVEDEWQPNPPCGKGHLDEHKDALGFIDLVFTPSLVRLDCRGKSVEEIAGRIAAKLRKPR